MATKWRSFFQDQRLALPAKAAAFGLLAVILRGSEGALLSVVLFLGGGIFLYLLPFPKQKFRPATFVIFLGLALVTAIGKPVDVNPVLLFVTDAVLFFILLGIRQLFFIYRRIWHYLIFLSLAYASFFSFFTTDQSRAWFWKVITLAIVIWFLIRDLFASHQGQDDAGGKKILIQICATTVTALTIELVWVISLLPLSPLSAANLAFLGLFTLNELVISYVRGDLTRREVLIQTSVFVLVTLLIFGSTNWGI